MTSNKKVIQDSAQKIFKGYWYRFELSGGKAHTNRHVKYEWSSYAYTEEDKDVLWNSWANKFGYERMRGDVTLLEKLPPEAKEWLTNHYMSLKSKAETMLKLLEES